MRNQPRSAIHHLSQVQIGRRIHDARKRADMTLKTLSDAVGVSQYVLGKYEAGTVLPSTINILKLCDALNVSADWLLGTRVYNHIDALNNLPPEQRKQIIDRIHMLQNSEETV